MAACEVGTPRVPRIAPPPGGQPRVTRSFTRRLLEGTDFPQLPSLPPSPQCPHHQQQQQQARARPLHSSSRTTNKLGPARFGRSTSGQAGDAWDLGNQMSLRRRGSPRQDCGGASTAGTGSCSSPPGAPPLHSAAAETRGESLHPGWIREGHSCEMGPTSTAEPQRREGALFSSSSTTGTGSPSEGGLLGVDSWKSLSWEDSNQAKPYQFARDGTASQRPPWLCADLLPPRHVPGSDARLAVERLLSPGDETESTGERVSLAVPLPYDRGVAAPWWAGVLRQGAGVGRGRGEHQLGLAPCPGLALAVGGAVMRCAGMPRTLSLTAGSEAQEPDTDAVVSATWGVPSEGVQGRQGNAWNPGPALAQAAPAEHGLFCPRALAPAPEGALFPCHALALAFGGAVVGCGGVPRTLSLTSASESTASTTESESTDDTSDGFFASSEGSGLRLLDGRAQLPTISE